VADLQSFYNEVLEKLFGEAVERRKFIDHVISELRNSWDKYDVFIIEAPTGYGKTTISATISLYSINEELKSIIALPLRSLLEDQYDKYKKLASTMLVGKRYMNNPDSRYLSKPITLTTIDTLSFTLFGLSPEDFDKVVKYWSGTSMGSLGHYLFSVASVTLSNVILDEVHLLADEIKSLNFLVALIHLSIRNNQKLVLMSATIPTAFEKVLEEELRKHMSRIRFIRFGKECIDEKFVNERLSKNYEIEIVGLKEENRENYIKKYIQNKIDEGSCKRVIVIFNTVKDAISFYNALETSNTPKLLLHSRFSEEDKEKKIEKLKEYKKLDKYIIVSTQVIEAGIDISSDLMITEIAPINSLIQRVGRFLRYEGEEKGTLLIWYEIDEQNSLKKSGENNEKYKVYDYDLTKRTLDSLLNAKSKGRINFHVPSSKDVIGYKDLMNMVYHESDFKVKSREVTSLLNISLNIETMPYSALKQLMRLEGSFVRDSILIPIIPKSLISENENYDLENLQKLVIPISFNTFTKLLEKSLIKSCICKSRESEHERPTTHIKPLDENTVKELRNPVRGIENLLRIMSKEGISAFILDANYDGERGLMIEYE
jgi:CRISPR-associated endonuclease/helicase Cas3